jgi:hypothetical protein
MKIVHGNKYFAIEALLEVPKKYSDLYYKARDICPEFRHNLAKIASDETSVSLLYYPNLETSAHPYLSSSCTIDLSSKKFKINNYSTDNPVILHQLETMLSEKNSRIPKLLELTKKEKEVGLFRDEIIMKIGRLKFWNELCKEKRLNQSIATTDTVKTQLDLFGAEQNELKMEIPRHKTAMSIKNPSVSTKYALSKDVIKNTVYDFGCGRGRDSKWLKSRGYEVISFDPYYSPQFTPEVVDFSGIKTILINYVFNVIEVPDERTKLLQNLLNKTLKGTTFIISVRSQKEIEEQAKKGNWEKYTDGYITSINTFQHGYNINEFTNFIKTFKVNIIEIRDLERMGLMGIFTSQ